MPYRHRVGTHKIRTYPPIATIHVEFLFCGNVGVVFVRKLVHLANHFLSATQFEHGFSEPCVTSKSIVNVLVFFVLCTSFGVDLQYGILYHLLSSRSCDRVAGSS